MTEHLTWVTFSQPATDSDEPVTRRQLLDAALEELAELAIADPTIAGATVELGPGDRVDLAFAGLALARTQGRA